MILSLSFLGGTCDIGEFNKCCCRAFISVNWQCRQICPGDQWYLVLLSQLLYLYHLLVWTVFLLQPSSFASNLWPEACAQSFEASTRCLLSAGVFHDKACGWFFVATTRLFSTGVLHSDVVSLLSSTVCIILSRFTAGIPFRQHGYI